MKLHIIHLPHRTDRMETLQRELKKQSIIDYRIWDGIVDKEKPARGISHAHKQIVEFAKKEGLPEVLIAEDDIHFTDDGAFDYYLSKRPADYDIYLGGVYYGELRDGNTVNDFSGLTLYTINARFYDAFLALPPNENIDRAMKGKGRYVVCDPFVVTQYNGFSDNARKEVNYDHWLRNRSFYMKPLD